MVSKWVISPTYKWGMLGWNHPLILTIDPNFQRDIQVASQSLTASLPLKAMVGKEDDPASYWGPVTFQGRAV